MARGRITKAEKELRDLKVSYTEILKSVSHQVSVSAFAFPAVKEKASAAHAALVDLAEAIAQV